MSEQQTTRKILVMANRDFVLYNFRVELLERLLEERWEVYICLPDGPKVKLMIDMGCRFVPVEIDKRGTNPFRDIKLIRCYREIFKKIQPDMILTYTTKVCIYAGIVAGQMKIPYIMNVSGLGTAVEQPGLLQPLMIRLYRKAAKKAQCVFFQNTENQKFFHEHHMYRGRERLIPGSGVNLEKWKYLEYPSEEKGLNFLFIARVIREKGIEEYLYCAETIKQKYPNTTFHVLGPCDGEYKDILRTYEKRGIIQYHGEVSDTAEYLRSAHCLIHPSFYPEGISNVCLEAAASGRAVITTNRAGCRETVQDGVTGYLVPVKDKIELTHDIEVFLSMGEYARANMGLLGHKKIEKEFDRKLVVRAYWEEILRVIGE